MNSKIAVSILALIILALGAVLIWDFMSERDQNTRETTNDEIEPQPTVTEEDEETSGRDMTQEEREEVVREYITDNISDLSPEEEVLGGTFYVTDIRFTGDNSGVVEYEDGHIALTADFEYGFDAQGNPQVTLSNVTEQ